MKIPSDDRIKVLDAKIAHDGVWFTSLFFFVSLLYLFMSAVFLTAVLELVGLESISAGILQIVAGILLAFTVVVSYLAWPLRITRTDWLMWEATRPEREPTG